MFPLLLILPKEIPRDWFDYANLSVGVLGLLLTVAAIAQATGAKKAARNAEKSVLRHHAEIDFAALARMAKELHGYIESGSMAEAKLRTTDLRSELALAVRRHESLLGLSIRDLREKQVDLKLMTDGLNRMSGALSESEKVRLLGIAGAILETLAGKSGELQSSAKREVAHG